MSNRFERAPGRPEMTNVNCPSCGGTGKDKDDKDGKCRRCSGTGKVRAS